MSERTNRVGQKCQYCDKPLRAMKADRVHGFDWRRKYNKKCLKEVEFLQRMKWEYPDMHKNNCKCFLCK